MTAVLLYWLEQGPTEKAILQACARERRPPPARIANAPDLLPGLELFYLAFMDLTSCRGQGYGTEGPISWLTIDDYAARCGYLGEQREDLIYHMQRMDAEYLKYKTKKLEAANKPAPKKGK